METESCFLDCLFLDDTLIPMVGQHPILKRLDVRFARPAMPLGGLLVEMGNNPEVDVHQFRNAAGWVDV
jgi:hypothetical protein